MPLAADTRDVYDRLAELYLPIGLAVLGLVLASLVWLVWRGRRRREPRRGTENAPVEIAYAILLAAVVAVLVVATFSAQDEIDAKSRPAAEQVRVVAAKWSWRFEHPRYGIAETGRSGAPAVLTVPAGVEVDFRATALDVIHALWIPSMRFQRQLVPGRTVEFRLTFAKPGFTTNAACAFYCGLYHGRMRFAVRVLPRAEFAAWARSGGKR